MVKSTLKYLDFFMSYFSDQFLTASPSPDNFNIISNFNLEKMMKILSHLFLLIVTFSAAASETRLLFDTSYLIKNPTHYGSDLGFSGYNFKSSETGLCRALGYERAAPGSMRNSDSQFNAIQVNSEGYVIGGPKDYIVTQIICINKLSTYVGDISAKIINPGHPGSNLPYSAYNFKSSEHGICKTLGYEKAASGSLRNSDAQYNSIQVNSSGVVIGGPRDYVVTQIICLNKQSLNPAGDISFYIKNPTHPGSNLGFSAYNYKSSETGICRALGYERAAPGSLRNSDTQLNSIQLNTEGNIIGGPRDYVVTQIVCLNETGIYTNETSILVKDPIHPLSGMKFSAYNYKSSEQGVCRALGLGYDKAASGSLRNSDSQDNSVQVNSNGDIIGGPRDYVVTQIICIIKI